MGTGEEVHEVHVDHLGTPRMLTDATGAASWRAYPEAYGKAHVDSPGGVTFHLRFPGQYYDEESERWEPDGLGGGSFRAGTGMHYNRFRHYDPTLGRFVSADPIGQKGGANVYEYALNLPTSFIDPFGLDIWVEGPSGNEPNAHQSINVGDPYGEYESKSFGVGPACWTGCVYEDVEKGGPIELYFETTPEQDAEAIAALEGSAATDSEAIYGVGATCRTYSQDKFKEFSEEYQNSSSELPNRPSVPRAPFRQLSGPSGTTSTTTSSPGTSTSR